MRASAYYCADLGTNVLQYAGVRVDDGEGSRV